MTDPVPFPATCGDMVDAYPPSYDAVCPVHGPVRVLTALTDPENFRAAWLPEEDTRDAYPPSSAPPLRTLPASAE